MNYYAKCALNRNHPANSEHRLASFHKNPIPLQLPRATDIPFPRYFKKQLEEYTKARDAKKKRDLHSIKARLKLITVSSPKHPSPKRKTGEVVRAKPEQLRLLQNYQHLVQDSTLSPADIRQLTETKGFCSLFSQTDESDLTSPLISEWSPNRLGKLAADARLMHNIRQSTTRLPFYREKTHPGPSSRLEELRAGGSDYRLFLVNSIRARLGRAPALPSLSLESSSLASPSRSPAAERSPFRKSDLVSQAVAANRRNGNARNVLKYTATVPVALRNASENMRPTMLRKCSSKRLVTIIKRSSLQQLAEKIKGFFETYPVDEGSHYRPDSIERETNYLLQMFAEHRDIPPAKIVQLFKRTHEEGMQRAKIAGGNLYMLCDAFI